MDYFPNVFYGLDFSGLSSHYIFLLIFCIILVAAFEFINGFHDTANAVATVIYTKSLKPFHAVLLSGTLNFLGVLLGGIAVAIGIINLLPLSELVSITIDEKVALIFAMLITAIFWNIFTWYYGIPCSSSHTLIGAILGIGIAFRYFHGGKGVNWDKAFDIGYSLLFSPFFGFSMAILMIFFMIKVLKLKKLFRKPKKKNDAPPILVRITLIATCSLVSFFHGSNDGQKGVGLLLVVMMTFLPASFLINPKIDAPQFKNDLAKLETALLKYNDKSYNIQPVLLQINELKILQNVESQTVYQKSEIRKKLLSLEKSVKSLQKEEHLALAYSDAKVLKSSQESIEHYISFAPIWVLLVISLSLGIGTMVGYQRIVKTIGEKIGKDHLTYGQGAASEIIAAITIGLSSKLGLPVSTTHVLSSAIAGSMVATGGVKNLQQKTIKNIAWAWILTLPVTILLAIILYVIFRAVFV